jgi:Conjugal transfer protein TrbL
VPPSMPARVPIGAAAVTAVAVISLVSPEDSRAAIDLTPSLPNPFDIGIPGPADLVGKVFEFFFETFFGIEAKVTRRAVEWLIAAPIYTDRTQFGELNQLRSYVTVAAWALFTLVFTVSGVRYYASGFTSGGSYEAVEALSRGGLAAGALAVYPEVFGSLSVATNHLTYGITHAPGVESGLTKLIGAATVASFTPLGVGTIAAVVAVVLLLLLLVTKIVIATLLALLYVAAPLAIALWPLPETSWLARTWLQSLIGVLLWPVVWALCFALFAVMGASAFTLTGSFGTELVKPWVAVAALFVSFKAPQLLARQAMLAGLTPSLGNTAARGLVYGRAALRAGGGAGAEGVSGRFGGGAAGTAAKGAGAA